MKQDYLEADLLSAKSRDKLRHKIIESQDLGSLAEKVNAALKEGWQPHGAPFILVSGAAGVCCQAIVNFHQPTSAETIAKLRRAAASVFRR